MAHSFDPWSVKTFVAGTAVWFTFSASPCFWRFCFTTGSRGGRSATLTGVREAGETGSGKEGRAAAEKETDCGQGRKAAAGNVRIIPAAFADFGVYSRRLFFAPLSRFGTVA